MRRSCWTEWTGSPGSRTGRYTARRRPGQGGQVHANSKPSRRTVSGSTPNAELREEVWPLKPAGIFRVQKMFPRLRVAFLLFPDPFPAF